MAVGDVFGEYRFGDGERFFGDGERFWKRGEGARCFIGGDERDFGEGERFRFSNVDSGDFSRSPVAVRGGIRLGSKVLLE